MNDEHDNGGVELGSWKRMPTIEAARRRGRSSQQPERRAVTPRPGRVMAHHPFPERSEQRRSQAAEIEKTRHQLEMHVISRTAI